jgi:hypothetical protein
VDRFVVGDELAEFAEIVEYDLATDIGNALLADAGLLQEFLEGALNRIKAKPLGGVFQGVAVGLCPSTFSRSAIARKKSPSAFIA